MAISISASLDENVINWDLENTWTGGITVDAKAILQRLERLVETEKNSIPFNREFGLDLEAILFKPLSNINAISLINQLRAKFARYVPDVQIDDFDFTISESQRKYIFNIGVSIPRLSQSLVVYNVEFNNYFSQI